MKNILLLLIFSGILGMGLTASSSTRQLNSDDELAQQPDSLNIEYTRPLPYNFDDEESFETESEQDNSELYLNSPSNIETVTEYDPITLDYVIYRKIGDFNYRLPQTLSLEDYSSKALENSIKSYWAQKRHQQNIDGQNGLIPQLTIGGEAFSRIFGGNTIDISPQGYIDVNFGFQTNKTENPSISERLRKTTTFDFDQEIKMSVTGKIGEKMNMRVNYDTEATFDYENKMKLDYSGDEDEIIKKVEAGNVSLPLNGSLITGATNLFGIKTEMQFGKLTLTSILSQNKGETTVVETEGGAQSNSFQLDVTDYDENRHFFLSQFFYDNYDNALSNLPIIQSSITIDKIEVWVTNKSGDYDESRNIIAFMDLGEHNGNIYNTVPGFQDNGGQSYPLSVFPSNSANNMYEELTSNYSNIRQVDQISKTLSPLSSYNFTGGQDFEKIEQARKLSESEYMVDLNLGYISLNSSLNSDEVLAVAFSYTANGATYQVGEFSSDGIDAPQTLVLKLIKGTNLTPKLPTWQLMMKNIYSLDAYDITAEDFNFNILYLNDSTGSYINYLPESNIKGNILLNVMNLDNLNSQLDPGSDGAFDFIEGITIRPDNGRVIFPAVEPFGSHLRDSLIGQQFIDKYVYESLYDSTKTYAEQDSEHNKYILKGNYSGSSSSEISLGSFNLAEGSVKVSAGGIELTENIDYTVDYTLGSVRIINESLLESGTAITVTTESEDLFTSERKTMLGTHANYAFSDNFNLGATVLHLSERPLTQKVDYGQDAISNTMLGLDATYSTESQLLTNLVDKLPFIETKATSTIALEAEFAKLLPGHSNVVGKDGGTVYIDDFESTKTSINIKSKHSWVLASTPQNQSLFPEADTDDDLSYGFNRAKLAWYVIDPILLRNTPQTPSHLKYDSNQKSNHLVREVFEAELYPEKDTETGTPTNISVLDLAYYPEERGPYNFDTNGSSYSSGLNPDGTLKDPGTRWAGIMREVETTNFESANIEYIEFWLMDPFVNDTILHEMEGGDLYFNLGDVSEDILKDSRKSFENGLPETEEIADVDTTIWGRISTQQQITNSFVANDDALVLQDVGLDGLDDEDEQEYFSNYVTTLETILDANSYEEFANDPAGDDYHYFRGNDYDILELGILERYKKYNGLEGNSMPASLSDESYATSATTRPDAEDINDDNTLSEYEKYYQYRVSIRPEDMQVGSNYISDIKEGTVELDNGKVSSVNWYQFKIPVKQPDQTIGNISDFKSIRFIRMFLKEFEDPVVLRFASLDLVRADWRRYTSEVDDEIVPTVANTEFEVSAVNIEENSEREPINYVLPPGIDRVVDPSSQQLLQLNEQSMVLKVTDLPQGDARAAYKSIGMDFRQYERLQLEVHAEEINGHPLDDGDLYFFVRLGSDYTSNYYEYEIPLSLTEHGDYSNISEEARYAVWPDENRINIPLSTFTDAKTSRNNELGNGSVSINEVYEQPHTDWHGNRNNVRIKGSPNLGDVEVMMMGIRHKVEGTYNPGPRSVEVWANELRLTGFNEEGGWATNVRLSTRLADLGSVVFAGRHKSTGFGSIDQSVQERSMEDLTEYDISSNFQLGRFFPEEAQVNIPLYIGISKSFSNPKYNPLNPDITMAESLRNLDSKSEKDSLKNLVQDYSSFTSIVLNNIKVDKTNKSGNPRLWDPTNFSLSFSHNIERSRNIDTKYSIEKNYMLGFNYNFNKRETYIEPFKNVSFLNGKFFSLIKSINFSPLPSQISYNTQLYRYYKETQSRDITNTNLKIPLTVDKEFIWTRNFDMRYNLTRSLRIDFSSKTDARIDEPEGRINRIDDDYEFKKDSIMTNLLSGGRPVLYDHTINARYTLPINKISFFNWVSSNASYTGTYSWTAGAITDETIELGNTIQNSRNMQLTSQANMQSLYNKVPFLKEVNDKIGSNTRSTRSSSSRARAAQQNQEQENDVRMKKVQYRDDGLSLKKDSAITINHRLRTEEIEVLVLNEEGKSVNSEVEVINDNQVLITPGTDVEEANINITGEREIQNDIGYKILQYTARTLMSLKNISLTLSETEATSMPGFLPEPSFLGSGRYTPDAATFGDIAATTAPGLPFLLGWQDDNFAMKAAEKGWITKDSTLNAPYIMSHQDVVSIRATLEPMPFLEIRLTGNRSFSENLREYYIYDTSTGIFNATSQTISGNFSMTVSTWKTAFSKMGEAGVEASDAYQDMLNNRITIAKRLASRRVPNSTVEYHPEATDDTGFPVGYGATSQEVLIPAFIAAYTGQDPNKVSLSPFPSLKFLRPNWTISYDGIVSNINGLNKIFKTIDIQHSYTSRYSVGSYKTRPDFDNTLWGDGWSYATNNNGNFISEFDINSVSISESMNPLINLNLTWLNDLSTQFEINKRRSLTLNFANNQLTEVLSRELSIGLGYTFDKMDLIIKTKSSQKAYSNDLKINVAMSFRKNKTILRKLVESEDQLTAGQNAVAIETTAEYYLSDRFRLQFYYDKTINKPYTSTSYPTSNSNLGLSFRFTLTQ